MDESLENSHQCQRSLCWHRVCLLLLLLMKHAAHTHTHSNNNRHVHSGKKTRTYAKSLLNKAINMERAVHSYCVLHVCVCVFMEPLTCDYLPPFLAFPFAFFFYIHKRFCRGYFISFSGFHFSSFCGFLSRLALLAFMRH